MDKWALPETVTVGTVFVAMIIFLWQVVRNSGSAPNPELIQLNSQMLTVYNALNKSIAEQTAVNQEQSKILCSLVETINTMTQQITQAMGAVITKAQGEHEEMQTQIGALLTGQTASHKLVEDTKALAGEIMTTLDNPEQLELLRQIAEKLDQVQKTVEELRTEFSNGLSRVNEVEHEVKTIRDEMRQVATLPKVSLTGETIEPATTIIQEVKPPQSKKQKPKQEKSNE